jgi:hypothetical protein
MGTPGLNAAREILGRRKLRRRLARAPLNDEARSG